MSTAQVAVRDTTAGASPHDPDPDGHLEAFRECRRTDDPQTRQDLVCHYLPLVRRIARRYVRTGVPLDDLTQIGSIGLINAVNSFDPERGVKFEAYAYHHIAGEIRHYLRDGAEHVRAPRWVRKSYGEVTNTAAGLRQTLGRTPTVTEIAAQMNLSVAGVLDILSAHNRARVHSINDLLEGQEIRPDVACDQQDPPLRFPWRTASCCSPPWSASPNCSARWSITSSFKISRRATSPGGWASHSGTFPECSPPR